MGPVRNRVLSGFAQDPRPVRSRVDQTNAAELIWPSVEIESPNRFQSYLGFVPSTSSSRLLVCEPGAFEHSVVVGSAGTVVGLCGRDVLRVPISSGWRRRQMGVGRTYLVTLNFTSWNQLSLWLRQLEDLRRVA